MNFRHAAALALVGWYLMLPPVDIPSGRYVEEAPIASWRKLVEYDTFTKCENRRQNDLRFYFSSLNWAKPDNREVERFDAMIDSENGWPSGTTRKIDAHMLQGYVSRRCIATDDPRLKSK
jgi:hypothetical protein